MALARLLLVLAHLVAAATPCAAPDAETLAPERLRAYTAAALHAHGAPPEAPDGELRAPCACGCDETPAGRLVSTPLGAALLAAAPAPQLPRAVHAAAHAPRLETRPPTLLEAVPRPS
jgi:hypothetical protein